MFDSLIAAMLIGYQSSSLIGLSSSGLAAAIAAVPRVLLTRNGDSLQLIKYTLAVQCVNSSF